MKLTEVCVCLATNQSLLREKQLSRLELRRKQFMEAALGCKKAGDMELARTYLRHAKGFERLVTAVKDGQSVDLNSVSYSSSTSIFSF